MADLERVRDAAPELLLALLDVLPYVEFPNSQFKAQVDAAEAAIERATGKTGREAWRIACAVAKATGG